MGGSYHELSKNVVKLVLRLADLPCECVPYPISLTVQIENPCHGFRAANRATINDPLLHADRFEHTSKLHAVSDTYAWDALGQGGNAGVQA